MPSQGERVEVGHLVAVLKKLKLPFGLVVDEVRIDAENAVVQKEPFIIHMPEPGEVEAEVSDVELAKFLNKQSPGGLSGFEVKLRDNKVHVLAKMKMILEVPVTAICTLRIVNERKVYVDLESVEVMGMGSKSLVEGQLEKINPVLDVAEFPIDLRLHTVTINEGRVVLTGKALPKP